MEPVYARVNKARRPELDLLPPPPPEFDDPPSFSQNLVENTAATIIQRAWRAHRLQGQFSQLLNLSRSPRKFKQSPQHSPEKLDELLLHAAAGLPTFSGSPCKGPSMRHIKNRRAIPRPEICESQDGYLRRTKSLRINRQKRMVEINRHMDDMDLSVPPPCPPLKGQYFDDDERIRKMAPRPPQRTVSFLVHDRLPRKLGPLPSPPIEEEATYGVRELLYGTTTNSHARSMSCQEAQCQQRNPSHNRSFSSPAPLSPPLSLVPPPLSPMDHVVIDIEDDVSEFPLPPPPYISPPPQRSSPPLPPPPPLIPETTTTPCDSSSSTSSIDSGFRSSIGEHGQPDGLKLKETEGWMSSPRFLASPSTTKAVQNSVFEPRSLFHDSKHNLEIYQNQPELFYGIKRNCNYEDFEDVHGRTNKPKVAGKKVRIQNPKSEFEEDLARRRQYRVGLNLFNQNPQRGMEFLIEKKFLEYSPASVAKFLKGRKGLSKKMIGEYMTSLQRTFNLAVLHCFVHEMDFSGLHLDVALRKLYEEVAFPGEAQKIEKLMEVFSRRYIQCNQMFVAGFNSPDTIFILSYAMVLLNTDLHAKAVKKNKMRREDFLQNLKGIDSGADVEEEMLKGIFDRIKGAEFKSGADHVSQVARLEDAIQDLKKKGQVLCSNQYRRLVCFCRLTEVVDMNKPLKTSVLKSGSTHQRGVFLFNDIIVVAKTVNKGKKTTHHFKHSHQLRDLRINVFCTNFYEFGIQLQDRLTGRIIATFNARSDTDRQRFVNDLQEAVAELNEMENANAQINDAETLC